MMTERNTETILEALAERLRDMKTELYLKDSIIEQKNEKIAELEGIIKELRDV